jgi:hypothetical protein
LRHNRKYIWIVAAGLILLLACSIWAMQERRQRVVLQNQAESYYQKNFYELAQHLDLIAGNLAQAVSCTSQEQTSLSLASVWRCSYAAQSNLGALPLSPVQLSQTEKFLFAARDTALWHMKKTAQTKACLSDPAKEEILALMNYAKQLCTEIGGISAEVMSRDSAFTRAPGQVLDRLQSMDRKLESMGDRGNPGSDNAVSQNLNPEEAQSGRDVSRNSGSGSFDSGSPVSGSAVPGNFDLAEPDQGNADSGGFAPDSAVPGNLIPWNAQLDGFNPEDPTRYFGAPPRNNRIESGISSAQGARIALEWWFGPGTGSQAASDSPGGSFEAILAYEGAGDISTYGYELRRIGQTLPIAYVDVTQDNGAVLWAMGMPGEGANAGAGSAVPTAPGSVAPTAGPNESGVRSATPGVRPNDSGAALDSDPVGYPDATGAPGPVGVNDATPNTVAAEKLVHVFLEIRGYPVMEIVQEEIRANPQTGGYGVYTLAPIQDEVLLYPDQIKIQVDLSRMAVIGFEGTPYYQHHRLRANLTAPLRPQWSRERIQAQASPLLRVAWIRLALIQDDLGGEILTWEVQGKLDDEIFSVFYNTETGAEEQILRRTQPRTYLFDASGR